MNIQKKNIFLYCMSDTRVKFYISQPRIQFKPLQILSFNFKTLENKVKESVHSEKKAEKIMVKGKDHKNIPEYKSTRFKTREVEGRRDPLCPTAIRRGMYKLIYLSPCSLF